MNVSPDFIENWNGKVNLESDFTDNSMEKRKKILRWTKMLNSIMKIGYLTYTFLARFK